MYSTGASRLAHSGLVTHAHSALRAAGRRWLFSLSWGLLAAVASVGWPQAHASELVWSVRVGTPGTVVHIGSHPVSQVIYQPVYQPVPVQVVALPPRWYGPGAGGGHGHRHHHHHHHHHHKHHHR